jgi:hypothetical protein
MSYNIFNQAHLPLKLALISGCTFLDKNNNSDTTSASKSVTKIGEILQIFKNQIQHETLKILPLIFEYEPSIWAMYTSAHHKANNLCHHLEMLVQDFKQAVDTEEVFELTDMARKIYNEFVLYNFHHMDDEEPVLNEILWRYYKDDVIVQIADNTINGNVKQEIMEQKVATAA